MEDNHVQAKLKKHFNFINLGGAAILIGLLIHIIANVVLKTFPSNKLDLIELQSYLNDEASTWALVHGIRYIAIVCIVIFACGLFLKTYEKSSSSIGWAMVGFFGAILMMANLLITNGIEILTFFDFKQISGQKELFWLLFNLTRVLFTGEIITWALIIFGFSLAGYYSATIPKWLVILGICSGTSCFLSAIFIVSILNDGWASIVIEVSSFTGLTWFTFMGIYMLPEIRKSRERTQPIDQSLLFRARDER